MEDLNTDVVGHVNSFIDDLEKRDITNFDVTSVWTWVTMIDGLDVTLEDVEKIINHRLVSQNR